MLSLDVIGPIFSAIGTFLFAVVGLYVLLSIVLFIVDGLKAKEQGRKIKIGIKIMFIIAMVILAAMLALGVYVIVLLFYLFIHGPF